MRLRRRRRQRIASIRICVSVPRAATVAVPSAVSASTPVIMPLPLGGSVAPVAAVISVAQRRRAASCRSRTARAVPVLVAVLMPPAWAKPNACACVPQLAGPCHISSNILHVHAQKPPMSRKTYERLVSATCCASLSCGGDRLAPRGADASRGCGCGFCGAPCDLPLASWAPAPKASNLNLEDG